MTYCLQTRLVNNSKGIKQHNSPSAAGFSTYIASRRSFIASVAAVDVGNDSSNATGKGHSRAKALHAQSLCKAYLAIAVYLESI